MTLLYPFFLLLILFSSCHRAPSDQSDQIVSMQLIDKNGFTETISIKDRLTPYQSVDFLSPQPYQKVLRVYGRNTAGQSSSKISSYHPNGHIWQLLDVVDGRAHGTYLEWYANGQLRIQSSIIEGLADINDLAQTSWVFDGTSQVWDEQGNLLAKIHYSKGLLHAPSVYYHANGQISQLIPYDQDNIHGESMTYDIEGNILEKIPYTQGQKQGTARGYWSAEIKSRLQNSGTQQNRPFEALSAPASSPTLSGMVSSAGDGQPLLSSQSTSKSSTFLGTGVLQPALEAYEEIYDKGLLLSATYYDPLGGKIGEIVNGNGMKPEFEQERLAMRMEFQKGVQQGLVEEYLPDNSLHCSYHILDGKKHGEEWEYYPSSTTPKLNLQWHEDQIEGQVKTWYENGTLESQREIHQQKKQGLCFAWYKNGDIMLVEEYANDLLIKGSYFKKGDKKVVSKIEDGNGSATLYTSEGIFWKKIPYEKGRPMLHDDSTAR